MLTEPISKNSYKTILPTGVYNEKNKKNEVLIVVKVLDALGGYTNITQIVET
jgi:hypothetical protein